MIQNMSPGRKNRDEESMEEGSKKRFRGNNNGSPYSGFQKKNMEDEDFEQNRNNKQHMPPASVMTRLILIMVWRKLIRNPNTYSSLFGLAWSLVSYKYSPTLSRKKKTHIYTPKIGRKYFNFDGPCLGK